MKGINEVKMDIAERPLIHIDFKKNRIRIHRNVLHALGNPDYVLLLVNPLEQLIAVKPCNRSDSRAHHISWSAAVRKTSFEIYSASFLNELQLCGDWDERHGYRIYGDAISKYGLVQFRIGDAFKHMRTNVTRE